MASHSIGMRTFSVLKCQDKCTAGELSHCVLSNLPDSIWWLSSHEGQEKRDLKSLHVTRLYLRIKQTT